MVKKGVGREGFCYLSTVTEAVFYILRLGQCRDKSILPAKRGFNREDKEVLCG